ncbi:MAG: SUMF1/EgtB/PvdO family nonheme iron enzyme [Planctomycetia bacterium]|nr:SUMF1/EgtB/PvdO family nonheme iron enzyme [Planctomycetia bacterium]
MSQWTRICALVSLAFFLLCSPVSRADEGVKLALLLDDPPVTPLCVENDILAEIVLELLAQSSSVDSVTLLSPSASGATSRQGDPVDLLDFDMLWIAQGGTITTDSALFSDGMCEALRAYYKSASTRGVILTGGAVALLQPLGLCESLTLVPLNFGNDRNQSGLIPVTPRSSFFTGVELDRQGVAWTTNASFPAFAKLEFTSDSLKILAQAADVNAPNPLLLALDDNGAVKLLAYPQRVSPMYDLAAPTFRANFTTLLTNLVSALGRPFDANDCLAPQYHAPDFDALARALAWFSDNFDEEEYPNVQDYLTRLESLRNDFDALLKDDPLCLSLQNATKEREIQKQFDELQRQALLENPELDFDSFFYITRNPNKLGLPENYNSNSVLPPTGYQNQLRLFNLRTNESALVYQPQHDEFLGDLELYYDADKLMFSAPDMTAQGRWRLWELPLQPQDAYFQTQDDQALPKPTLMPQINLPDVDNYDACYLPDDRVVFCSTACQSGVPCINGSGHVCNLYLLERDKSVRQLTLEQDHDWNPVVLNNGRVMYLRWEYVDLPHAFSRIMFHMNPDGTNQSELYGSGSYWPNSIFYARPLPGEGSKFVGVVTGHHELNRQGELVIFDPAQGRQEAQGAVQRIPGYGKKVEPIACDLPIAQSWPKFLHPFPISEHYFLVACKRAQNSPWEICLVDDFDNIVTLLKDEQFAALEPIPYRQTERQPIIPDRIVPDSPTADVFIADIYEGAGLKGVPRGEVKELRVFTYSFAYQGMGAEPYSVGLDGPWDPRRIIGTAPVLEDGSAFFKIPAYTPVALQPLDSQGRALQIMRSWITAVPGENVSCIGCHEQQNTTSTTNPRAMASQREPVEIQPFYGQPRPFAFEMEIQPILDHFCVQCHSPGSETVEKLIADGVVAPEVRESYTRANHTFADSRLPDFTRAAPQRPLVNGSYIANKSPISNAYYQLRRYLHTTTKESQMPTHRPYEFAAETQPLVQILQNGHYGVTLDDQAWRKLYTWIDLNAPYFGNWGDMLRQDAPERVENQWRRREELRALYATSATTQDDDPRYVRDGSDAQAYQPQTQRLLFSVRQEDSAPQDVGELTATPGVERVSLADNVELELVEIPALNLSVARFETTNRQYRAYDPTFDAGIEYGDFINFSPGERGALLSRAQQPVVRVTWLDAVNFCKWLSEKTGDVYRLPTKEEWRRLACETDNAFWFGALQDDYSSYENLADASHARISPFGWEGRVSTLPAWRPVDWNCDDHSAVAAPVGSYRANPLGLYDMVGNVAEWTDSQCVETCELEDVQTHEKTVSSERVKKVVCGGSWTTPERWAAPGKTRAYPPHYNLRDVGFRVVRENRK